jgi:REP element-mobilizing transposase RayT
MRQGAKLPHWRQENATYAVTFRLADSLPASVLEGWRRERREIVERAILMERSLTKYEEERLAELYSDKVQQWLDRGHGSCALRDPRVAGLVAGAITHFEGQRYDLHAWCVMPNHVHVVVQPRPDQPLSRILMSWKGFTGKEARKLLGGNAAFWESESYDHIVRDATDLARQIKYVLGNPVKAGLDDWPWVWAREVQSSPRH